MFIPVDENGRCIWVSIFLSVVIVLLLGAMLSKPFIEKQKSVYCCCDRSTTNALARDQTE